MWRHIVTICLQVVPLVQVENFATRWRRFHCHIAADWVHQLVLSSQPVILKLWFSSIWDAQRQMRGMLKCLIVCFVCYFGLIGPRQKALVDQKWWPRALKVISPLIPDYWWSWWTMMMIIIRLVGTERLVLIRCNMSEWNSGFTLMRCILYHCRKETKIGTELVVHQQYKYIKNKIGVGSVGIAL